ncbi:MAG TPA: DUF4012 domain-containing protein [Acidimicrobiales bacterium]|nr:DUF4012 domain-containing protein [Acidimicrobiales bacterium]
MRRAAAVLRVLAALGIAVTGWALAWSADALVAGRDAIDSVRAAEAADFIEGRPLPDLRRARRHLLDADERLRGPLLAPVRAMPVVGRQLRSLATVSRAAAAVAGTGVTSLTRAREVIGDGDVEGRASGLVALELSAVAADTRGELQGLDLGPARGLLGPVADARRELDDQLADLDAALERGAAGGRALATLLAGPRRYLVVAANNAEMRAGSGMFLSLGELETGGDALRLGEMQPAELLPVPQGAVPLEGDLRDRWGWLSPTEDFRNLMLSPRFDAQAPLAARMWQATGHAPVDGVISLDPVALKGMLAATGPVVVEGREFDVDSVLQELLHDQYVRFSREATPERRQQLGKLARAVFERLGAGGLSVPELARGLLPAIEGRHVLAWSARPDEQQDWAVAGVDGSLTADSLLVAVNNRGGNKLDQFLDVSSGLEVAEAGRDTLLTVRVTLRNRTPTGEPRYIAGPAEGSGVGEGVYLGIVSLSLPGAALDAYVEGEREVAVAGPDGPGQVIGLQLAVGRGEQRTVVVRFRLPGRDGSVVVEPSARVPAITWTSGRLRWADSARHVVSWA